MKTRAQLILGGAIVATALTPGCQMPVRHIYPGPQQRIDQVAVLYTGFEEIRDEQRARVVISYIDGVIVDAEETDLVAVLPGRHTVEVTYQRWLGGAGKKPRSFVKAGDPDQDFILGGGDTFKEEDGVLAESRFIFRFDITVEAGGKYRLTAEESRRPQAPEGESDEGRDLYIREAGGRWHLGSWQPRLVRVDD